MTFKRQNIIVYIIILSSSQNVRSACSPLASDFNSYNIQGGLQVIRLYFRDASRSLKYLGRVSIGQGWLQKKIKGTTRNTLFSQSIAQSSFHL